MKGYLVVSGNGRGKAYYYNELEEAKKELKKHSIFWKILKVEKTGEDSYRIIGEIICID